MVDEETGVHELVSESDYIKNRAFNELVAATPLAWVTIALIGVNLVVFFVMGFGGVSPFNPTAESLIVWGANYGPLTLQGQWWRLITAAFEHAGFLHLAFNMYCLFRGGIFAERVFGNAKYAAMYLLSGIGGNLASLFWHPLAPGSLNLHTTLRAIFVYWTKQIFCPNRGPLLMILHERGNLGAVRKGPFTVRACNFQCAGYAGAARVIAVASGGQSEYLGYTPKAYSTLQQAATSGK